MWEGSADMTNRIDNDPDLVTSVAGALWEYFLEREPYLRLRVGRPIEHLKLEGLEEAEEDAKFGREQLDLIAKVDAGSLPDDERVTHAFLKSFLTDLVDAPVRWWWSFPVTPYATYPLGAVAPQIFRSFNFDGASDVDRYLSVLKDYAAAIRSMRDKLYAMADRGWLLPKPALSGVIATLNGLKDGVGERALIDAERLQPLDPASAGKLRDGIDSALSKNIVPAYGELLLAVDELAASAPETVGLGQYPDGPDAYAHLVRYHATFEITPEQVHETGLREVEKVTARMEEVRESLDFKGSEEDFLEFLVSERRMYASTSEDVERKYRDAIARIEPHLGHCFAVIPQAPYEVARLDEALEAGMSYGYYEPPTDGKPAGVYRYNGSGLDTRSQLNAAALIYHELIPGHHFHIARQYENRQLSSAQRELGFFTAFAEGWAEYAAGLAEELGMYDNPYDMYGWLTQQRLMSQRLVVDSGMNALGWSLGKARDFMRRNTMESQTQLETETLRYSTDLPGQSLGYRLGFLKFNEIRRKAKQRLGKDFDIRWFHEAVLGPGALPLSIVEDNVMTLVTRRAYASSSTRS